MPRWTMVIGYRRKRSRAPGHLFNGEVVGAVVNIITASAPTAGRPLIEKLATDPAPDVKYRSGRHRQQNYCRETLKALRKDVLAKCYGGDVSRKRKLLEKQKEGKKRMKQMGNVEIPRKPAMAVLKVDSGGPLSACAFAARIAPCVLLADSGTNRRDGYLDLLGVSGAARAGEPDPRISLLRRGAGVCSTPRRYRLPAYVSR